MLITLACILALSVLAIVLYMRATVASQPVHFDIDFEDVQLMLSRIPQGLEAYVPSGRSTMYNVTIVADNEFTATIPTLKPGVTPIPRESFKDASGVIMPASHVVKSAMVTRGDSPGFVASFRWRGKGTP